MISLREQTVEQENYTFILHQFEILLAYVMFGTMRIARSLADVTNVTIQFTLDFNR